MKRESPAVEAEFTRVVIDKSLKPIDLEKEENDLKKHLIDLEFHKKKVDHFEAKI